MAAPGYAAMGAAVDVMRLRFGDKLRRASKMLDELQQDIFNDVRFEAFEIFFASLVI